MILDLEKFVARERPFWDELARILERLERSPRRLSLPEAERLHYLFQRASAGLGKLSTYSTDMQLRSYLDALVARAYAEVHNHREAAVRLRPFHWFFVRVPQVVRQHARALAVSIGITLLGAFFAVAVLNQSPEAKKFFIPPMFSHLLEDPSERVAQEESVTEDRMEGRRSQFAAQLMTHNIRVCCLTLAFGVTLGLISGVLLFYNGALLGMVIFDYVRAGETVFLTGWLLPHGSVEIPAILLGGQAAFVLAGAMAGRRLARPLRDRMRQALPSLVTLTGAIMVLLIWAGIVEAFFSQYHAPVLPYWIKISFGAVQLTLLIAWLTLAGRRAKSEANR